MIPHATVDGSRPEGVDTAFGWGGANRQVGRRCVCRRVHDEPLDGWYSLHLVDIVPPTLAVVASWICLGALIAGVGHVTRRALLLAADGRCADSLRPADLWIGLATLVAYLQVWNMVAAITWEAWILPVAAALVGIGMGSRALRGLKRPTLSWPVVAVVGVAVLWLANRSLAAALYYDLGLYHFSAIEYAAHFAAIPGLGNLHGRLGAGNGHLLFVAFLGHGPFARFGYHIANGLLATMLLGDIAWRFARRTPTRRLPSFTGRVALLLLPATLVAIVGGKGSRLNNPDLDFAVFVLVVVGILYLVECLEFGFRATPALVSTASLSLAATTRPFYWPLAGLSVGVVLLAGARHSGRRPALARATSRARAAVLLLPVALLGGWMGRQAVLSGYPLFPLTTGGLPVDWRMPTAAVHELNRFVSSWARSPGDRPDVVLASWDWLHPWLRHHLGDLDLVAPILFLACVLPALAGRSEAEIRRRRAWRRPMLALALPALPMLVAWFFNAPDPRFALAPLWLLPIALVAWALPGVGGRLPAAKAGVVAYASLAGVLLLTVGLVADKGVFWPIVSNGSGPLGTEPVPGAAVVPFVTKSGLEVYRPAHGELCWRVILCTPTPDPYLRLRGAGIRDGFSVGR
jgi:hypothetical protein